MMGSKRCRYIRGTNVYFPVAKATPPERSNNAAIMLTDKQIRDAKPRATVYRLRDTQSVCRGFGVVVAPSGSKSFFLSFTSPEDGKRKQVSLGKYPSTKLADARRLALEYRGKVDSGIDLAHERQQTISHKMEQRKLGTLGDLLDLYIADLEHDEKRTAKEVRRIKGKDIPSHLLSRPAHTVSRDDILDVLASIAQRGAKVRSDNVTPKPPFDTDGHVVFCQHE